MKFKKGDIAYTKATGYGVTSYEEYQVERVSKGKVKLYDLDTLYDAESGKGDGPSLGLEITVCVTVLDIENARKYCAEN